MLILSHADLIGLLPPKALIGPAESAAVAADQDGHRTPRRQHIEWNGNTLLTMPAVSSDMIGTKLVSVVPGNANSQPASHERRDGSWPTLGPAYRSRC